MQKRTPSVRYHKINSNDDAYADMQFVEPNPQPPYKAIGLAIFLFALGTILLTIGSLLVTGHIDVVKYADRKYPE